MIHSNDPLTIARAEALFASDAPAGMHLSRYEAGDAIRQALRRYGGVHGCAAELAARYGECPETAAPRMRWARDAVLTSYPRCPRGRATTYAGTRLG